MHRIILPFLLFAPIGFAQLTPAQKTSDFMQLVGLYAKNYAPYELRRDLFGFDLYNIQPWLDQIAKSADDITYYDILTRYVASLQDSHDEFTLPSDYEAWLHMDADLYDGKVLIGDLDRVYLPRAKYPFVVGDEVVSVDGVAAADLVQSFIPYAVNGSANQTSRMRLAAGFIFDRLQAWYPKAAQIGDSATLVLKRQNGNIETYAIPWDKTGTAIVKVGPVPSPHARPATHIGEVQRARTAKLQGMQQANLRLKAWGAYRGAPAYIEPDPVPEYMQAMLALQHAEALAAPAPVSAGIFPFDAATPLFNPPAGFKLRLGSKSTDFFLSGTFPSGNYTIGLIRVPTMAPSSTTSALNQFVAEMVYFQQNTDGLMIDIMDNGGGSLCYGQNLAQALIPYKFHGTTEQIRATQNWVASFSSSLTRATNSNAAQWVIDSYTAYLNQLQQAFAANRGLTGELPLCSASIDTLPLTDTTGKSIAYTKPILVLTDNFTLSTAESFTMLLQDAARATVFGTRTDGGGGNVVGYSSVANYSEGNARVTEGLIVRSKPTPTPGFPAGPYSLYYDGQGTYPDILQDYQTADNLLNGGKTFIDAATAAMVNQIQNGH